MQTFSVVGHGKKGPPEIHLFKKCWIWGNLLPQNNKTNMKNHKSHHINKNIDYLHNDNIYYKFQLLIYELKTKNIIPKIVMDIPADKNPRPRKPK